jgi:tRNA uridine 5-carbamoylmethylation protein Kti12
MEASKKSPGVSYNKVIPLNAPKAQPNTVQLIDKTKEVETRIQEYVKEAKDIAAKGNDKEKIDTPEEFQHMVTLLKSIASDQQAVGKFSLDQGNSLINQFSELINSQQKGTQALNNTLYELINKIDESAKLGSNISLGNE